MADLPEDIKKRLVPLDTSFDSSILQRLVPYNPEENSGPVMRSATTPEVEPNNNMTVKPLDRLKVKRASDDPDAQMRMLKNLGYNPVMGVGGTITVDGAPFDPPGMFANWNEPGQEIAENFDIPLGMTNSNPVTGATKELAVGAIDEMFRNELDPQADGMNLSRLGLRTVLGAGGGKLDSIQAAKALGKSERIKALTAMADEKLAGAKGLAGQAIDGAKPIIAKLAQDAKDEFLSDTRKYQGIANELGATASMMQTFGQKPVMENVEYLSKNSPEFVEGVLNQSFKNNRVRNISKLYNDTGTKIRNFYEKSDATVPVGDFFDSPAYKGLVNQMHDPRNSGKGAELTSLHDTYVRDLANHTQASIVVRNNPNYVEEAAKQGMEPNQYLATKMTDAFAKDPKTNQYTWDTDELIKQMKGSQINIKDLWNFRQSADEAAQYGVRVQDVDHKVAGIRSIAQASRDSIESALEKSGQTEMLKDIKMFNNLVPIVKSIDSDASNAATKDLNLKSTFYVSAIGGPLYRALGYAEKLANSPITKGLGRQVTDKAGQVFNGAKEMVGQGQELMSKIPSLPNMPDTQSVRRGLRNEVARLGANNMTEPNNTSIAFDPNDPQGLMTPTEPQVAPSPLEAFNPADYQDVIPQAPVKIPRDPELIAKTPQFAEALATELSPDTGRLFSDAVKSGDPLKMRMATIAAMQEAPDLFEESTTGMRSEVAVDGRMVLSDPQEAEMYQRTLRYQYKAGKIDANFYARQRSALNDPTNMEIFPVPGVTTKATPQIAPTPEPSTGRLNKLRDMTSRINTSVGDRRDYDY